MANQLKDPKGQVCYPRYTKLLWVTTSITIVLVLVLLGYSFFWICTHYAKPIDGASMQPGINNYEDSATGDIAIVNSIRNFDYGDIIIIDMANTGVIGMQDKLLIKRVIAKEGDSIKLIFENGFYNIYLKKSNESTFTKLEEDDYAYRMTSITKYNHFISQSNWATKAQINIDGSITIPEGYYFAMGDNRNVSDDCCNFGPLPNSSCIGVVEYILPRGNIFNTFFNWVADLKDQQA